MLLVKYEQELNVCVVNASYVKSWELNMDFDTQILCKVAGESDPRVLYDAAVDGHPDAHMAVTRAYDDMLDFLSGSEPVQDAGDDGKLRYFNLAVSVRSHKKGTPL